MFKVGQKVWCAMFGEGVVTKILTNNTRFPVEVVFCEIPEYYTLDGKYRTDATKTLFPHPVEIIKKVTKPSINWEHVRDEYRFLAQDADGNAYLYWEKPALASTGWQSTRGDLADAQSHVTYTPGTCDWQYSLVERP